MRATILLPLLILSSITLHSSNNEKIERKLSRLFEKGKLDKCRSKALKLRKKNPGSDIPVLYLSKIALYDYSCSKNISTQLKHLKRSAILSNKLSSDYTFYQTTIQDSVLSFIYTTHNPDDTNLTCKSAVKFYTNTYNDTTALYRYYWLGKPTISTYSNEILAVSDSLRIKLIQIAENLNGIRYTYAGETPETGFDCSGFTKYVYGQVGIEIPHNAHKQSLIEGQNKSLTEAEPGDLVFFGSQYNNTHSTVHAGIIYSIDDDIRVIHCVSNGVSIDGKNSSWEHYWKDKVLFVKSLVD